MAESKIKGDSAAPTPEELQQAVRLADPFGGDLKQFTGALENRQENHAAFLAHVDKYLKDKIDYGIIHRPPKAAKCYKGDDCDIPGHFTKPTMLKPGAEKVLGWLGATPVWPNLAAYEELALNGDPIQTIVLRCEGTLPDGTCIGFGFGGRAVSYKDDGTYRDLNRDLKMTKKSALVDCAITSGRLSEHFTQDVEDMTAETLAAKGQEAPKKKYGKGEQRWLDLKPDDPVPSGKHKGELVRELSAMYLKSLGEKNHNFREFCNRELDRRIKGEPSEEPRTGWKVKEIAIFTKEMKPATVKALLQDRHSTMNPNKLTRAENENLLAYLQAERKTRLQWGLNPDLARDVMTGRFGEHAEYRKLHPEQMKELGSLMKHFIKIDAAQQQIPDKYDALLADWENATGESLKTASEKQLKQLIDSIKANGFDG